MNNKKQFIRDMEICGEKMHCELRDGIPYVNGMAYDEYVDYLVMKGNWKLIGRLAWIGQEVRKSKLKDE